MHKKRAYHILMADVVDSRSKSGQIVGRKLNQIVQSVNDELTPLSPFVVTLGDEFQGVLDSLHTATAAIVSFERQCVVQKASFQLRYSLHLGVIESPINRVIAHGMLGPGLTQARAMLENKGPGRNPVLVEIGDASLDGALENLFAVLIALKSRWKPKDYDLILAMLDDESDRHVGAQFDKDRSQIWKRRNTLLIEEYRGIISVISWASSSDEPG